LNKASQQKSLAQPEQLKSKSKLDRVCVALAAVVALYCRMLA
jgi:hypothetical protein